ncbi:hypothetical protein AB5N19_02144 [Seiridium cardinale]|uniref:Uncharacterized protein n=1 Tax=Seiridium cardinale TaxID=138064 RepID=A0ABR2XMT3_9PEZI
MDTSTHINALPDTIESFQHNGGETRKASLTSDALDGEIVSTSIGASLSCSGRSATSSPSEPNVPSEPTGNGNASPTVSNEGANRYRIDVLGSPASGTLGRIEAWLTVSTGAPGYVAERQMAASRSDEPGSQSVESDASTSEQANTEEMQDTTSMAAQGLMEFSIQRMLADPDKPWSVYSLRSDLARGRA